METLKEFQQCFFIASTACILIYLICNHKIKKIGSELILSKKENENLKKEFDNLNDRKEDSEKNINEINDELKTIIEKTFIDTSYAGEKITGKDFIATVINNDIRQNIKILKEAAGLHLRNIIEDTYNVQAILHSKEVDLKEQTEKLKIKENTLAEIEQKIEETKSNLNEQKNQLKKEEQNFYDILSYKEIVFLLAVFIVLSFIYTFTVYNSEKLQINAIVLQAVFLTLLTIMAFMIFFFWWIFKKEQIKEKTNSKYFKKYIQKES